MTVGQLKKYLTKHNIPNSAQITVYVGGCDCREWCVLSASHDKAILIKDKRLQDSMCNIDNFDESELKGRCPKNRINLSIYAN